MADKIVSACPHCGRKYRVDPDHLGKQVPCQGPECGREFELQPADEAASVEATPEPTPEPEPEAAPEEHPEPEPELETEPEPAIDETPEEQSEPEPDLAPGHDAPLKLRRVVHDDFETVHPDTLIADIAQTPVLKAAWISLGLHLAVIILLSVGNIALCVKHRTPSLYTAFARKADEEKAVAEAKKKAEREKRRAEKDAGFQAEAKAKRAAEAAAEQQDSTPARPESKIEKELRETSSQRPTTSSVSLDNIEDDF
ncbi:hypothetical protein ACFL34_00920 [Candidatus Sumerlaeota bacterium]